MLADLFQQLQTEYAQLIQLEQKLTEAQSDQQQTRTDYLKLLFSPTFFSNESFFRAYSVLSLPNEINQPIVLPVVTSPRLSFYREGDSYQVLTHFSGHHYKGGLLFRNKTDSTIHFLIYNENRNLSRTVPPIFLPFSFGSGYGYPTVSFNPEVSIEQLANPLNEPDDRFPFFYNFVATLTQTALNCARDKRDKVSTECQTANEERQKLEDNLQKQIFNSFCPSN